MFCSRLNENSRQAKVSKLSFVLWLNENVRINSDVLASPSSFAPRRYPPKNLSLVYSLSNTLVSTNTILPPDKGFTQKIFSITKHETFVYIHHFNNVRLLLGTILATSSIKRG